MKLGLIPHVPPREGPLTDAHARMRGPAAVVAQGVAAILVASLPLLPGARERFGVGLVDTGLAMGAYTSVSLAATWTFWRRGAVSEYWHLVSLEIWTATAVLLYLVWASGDALSPWWLLFVLLLLVNAFEPALRWVDVAALVLGPLGVALAFLIAGTRAGGAEAGEAGLALVAAVALIALFAILRGLFTGLNEARVERDGLRAEVAELRLREERSRISRDLHDGLGTELAGLTWFARDLHTHLEGSADQAAVGEILERLRSGTDELRTVVWALRAERRSWSELVDRLRRRCTELGGGAAVDFEAAVTRAGATPPALEGQLALNVVRAVQELVHNAARHSGATRIAVSIALGERALRCEVVDDGKGLAEGVLEREEGGLLIVRTRVGAVGGALAVSAGPSGVSGTRILLTVPL